MRFKNDRIEGEVFVVAKDLFDAVNQVDSGFILNSEDEAENRQEYPKKIYRVEVTIFEA